MATTGKNQGDSPVLSRLRGTNAIVLSTLCALIFVSSTAIAQPINGLGRLDKPLSNTLIHKVAVFEKDDRRPVPKEFSALKSRIGLLYNGQSKILCTAFCLAPDVIGTAAHCLFGSNPKKKPKLSNFYFRIEDVKKISEAKLAGHQTGASRHFIVAGTTGLRTRPPMDAPRDWALAKLATPACKFGTLRLSPKPLNKLVNAGREKRIFQVAYHSDYKHWQPAYSGPCEIKQYSGKLRWNKVKRLFAEPQSLVLHTCDMGDASSGSPILMATNSDPVVVAVNVGSYEQSHVLIRDGRVIRRSRSNIIANAGVNTTAFAELMEPFAKAQILATNDELKKLQAELKAIGLYSGKLDGLYGPRTKRAIRQYETRKNWQVTGIPSQTILTELAAQASGNALAEKNNENNKTAALNKDKPELTTVPIIQTSPSAAIAAEGTEPQLFTPDQDTSWPPPLPETKKTNDGAIISTEGKFVLPIPTGKDIWRSLNSWLN